MVPNNLNTDQWVISHGDDNIIGISSGVEKSNTAIVTYENLGVKVYEVRKDKMLIKKQRFSDLFSIS